MAVDRRPLTRREALAIGWGVGVGLALGRIPLTPRAAAARSERQEAALLTRPIPSTGARIPVIGIGTARRYNVGNSEAERAPLREVLRAFARMGGSVVDTAPSYGTAERVVGALVADLGIRDRLFIATKVGGGARGVKVGLAEMGQSLTRLRTNNLDLLQVHNLAGVDAILPVLRDWKREGRIRYLGVSTSFERQHGALVALMQHEALDFIQVDYAIDNRAAADRILPLAADRGIAVLTNLPFGRGRVFQVFGDRPVPEWAAELGIASWAQFALKYVVSHPAVTCAIPGTATPAYLADNLGAARGPLPDETTRRRMAALVDEAPGRAR